MSTMHDRSTRRRPSQARPGVATMSPDRSSPREHFIPLRRADLVERLSSWPDLSAADRDAFGRLAQLLAATFHFEYHRQFEELKDAYAPFDPDADTIAPGDKSPENRETRLGRLFERFAWFIERSNFRHLSREEIDAALTACSDWGLQVNVDFRVFQRLEIYARGDVIGTRWRRRWRRLFRWEEVAVPTYQRLIVIFQLRENTRTTRKLDTNDVFIKVFKDIPKMDLEMLLPGSQVKMSLVDRTKILLPTLSGVGITVWKLISGAVVAAAVGLYGVLATLGLVGGTVGYGIRSLYGYLNTRQKYQLSLTESLYYQNLDNNAGVLFRILDEAEEQENRETLLAYFFLWQKAPPDGWTADQLDREIERYLVGILDRDVDFEVADALAKLHRLGLVETLPGDRLKATPIAVALESLDRAWDEYFDYHKVG